MRRLRTASLPRLLAIVAVLVAVVAGAGIAQAALTGAQKPAPKALDQAVLDAVNAPPVQGVTRPDRVHQQPPPQRLAPPRHRLPHPDGRHRAPVAGQRRALRLELQSTNGDAQIVSDGKKFLFYDATSKTAFTGTLPQDDASKPATPDKPATLAGVAEGSRQARRDVAALRRHADHDRQPPQLHRPHRPQGRRRAARRGRARLGRRPRRAAARRDLRPGLDEARSSSCRRPTSPTARSRRPSSTRPRPRAPR